MPTSSNALFASWQHPGAYVMFDRGWVHRLLGNVGLRIVELRPPDEHTPQWWLLCQKGV
jgi:hypothetical protein